MPKSRWSEYPWLYEGYKSNFLKNNIYTDETSHEQNYFTQEYDYLGEFHMAFKKQIIDI
jgi:hypothetical protein